MSKVVTTVRGNIAPEELGVTSMHDHILCEFKLFDEMAKTLPPLPPEKTELTGENMEFLRGQGLLYNPAMYNVLDEDYVAYELAVFKRLGGSSVLDGSAMDVRGSIEGIRRISEKTEVNIVAATGLYRPSSMDPAYASKDSEELFALCMQEIEEGIDGTDIKAGSVKSAIDAPGPVNGLAEEDARCLGISARVAAETGYLLSMHLSFPTIMPSVVVTTVEKLMKEHGLAPEKIYVCHNDTYAMHKPDNGGCRALEEYVKDPEAGRNASFDLPLRLLDMGVNIGLDGWGMRMPMAPFMGFDDDDRIKIAYQLISRGYAGQIVFGHDLIGPVGGVQNGGYGMTRFLDYGVAQLLALGISQEDIDKITTENPARMLAHD